MTDTFELTNGKVRPGLTRPSDVEPQEPRTEAERLEGRNPDGTVAAGNQIALGRGWKNTIRKAATRSAKVVGADGPTEDDIRRILSDTEVVYRAVVSSAPVSGPLMRLNAAGVAREFALAGYFDAKAIEAGLLTPAGEALVQRASYHRQRAERLSATTHTLSQRARQQSKKRGPGPWVDMKKDSK